jgi:membrane fusion protein (multidrug efflux system)
VSPFRQFAILLVVAAIAGGAWLLLGAPGPAAVERASEARPIAVRVAEAKLDIVRDTVEAVATSRAEEAIEIQPVVSGRIEAIHFAPGQRVGKGELLVTLDSGAEQAAVDEARALLTDAHGQYERGEQLARTRSVADARVEELRAAFLAAQARLVAAAERLSERQIRAPFAGVVGLREISVGARVEEGTKITTLDALDSLEIEFSVPEQFYARIANGTSVIATTSSYPDRQFDGTVTSIDSRVDPVARAFRVRARIPNPDLALPAGMFMVVQIVLDEREAVVVPEEAVLIQGRSAFVFRIAEGKAQRIEVSLGRRTFGEVEVRSGLAAGERIAITGVQRLRDGSRVEIQETPPAVAVG